MNKAFQNFFLCEELGVCLRARLPVQRRYAVDGLEAATRRHHIEAVSAVAGDVEVVFGVAVFHHHNEPCPAVGQVVARHSLTALRTHTHAYKHNQRGGVTHLTLESMTIYTDFPRTLRHQLSLGNAVFDDGAG